MADVRGLIHSSLSLSLSDSESLPDDSLSDSLSDSSFESDLVWAADYGSYFLSSVF